LVYVGMKSISDAKICVLGLSYRGDIPDTRESPTYALISELISRGFSRITVHDPFVRSDDYLKRKQILLTNNLAQCLSGAKIVVASTDHSIYKDLTTKTIKEISGENEIIIIDGRNIIKYSEEIEADRKCLYGGVGKIWKWC